MTVEYVVFDIGGVLVDWQPHLAFAPELGSREAAEAFMTRVDFRAKNMRADRGERFTDLADEIDDPADRALLKTYVTHYARTVVDRIEGSWALLDRIKDQGRPIFAITNWSAETWPHGVKAQPRLGEVFETLVVSGQEGIMKPEAAIYEIMCTRAGVQPEQCVFIDDGAHNVDGAKAVGMDGIHFTGPDALEVALAARGLL